MNYAGNSQCQWTIQVPAGKTITLTFTHFEVEERDPLIARCYDNVLVYDGTTAGAERHGECTGKLSGHFCM